MPKKIAVKLILQLHNKGMSQNAIAKSRHISKHSISDVVEIAKSRHISYEQIADQSDDDVYRMFFPDKYQFENIYEPVDYEYVHEQLKEIGTTLKLLWDEYQDKCREKDVLPMGYRRFCDGYSSFVVNKELTNRLEHKPGDSCEVDWSGPTMHYTVPDTGEVIKVYLFVGCLPFSQYAFVEPTLDVKMESWIRCHVHMYEAFGGVPARTICDNLKTGVVSHPREGEIILTEDYEAMGMYYVTAIMPAQVRKPKHYLQTQIIFKNRREQFKHCTSAIWF